MQASDMQSIHRAAPLVLALLLAACASAPPPAADALNPPGARISDAAIHADHAAYRAMQARIQALNDRGITAQPAGPRVSNYHLSKAQCWLDVSFHEYTRNDRSAFPQAALDESRKLIEALERNAAPLPFDTPLVNGADRLRPDLWDAAAALRTHAGFQCAAQQAACAEVELVHAGNEHKQFGWRHAKPYVQIAEDLISGAQAAAARCAVPAPPSAPVVPPAPPPPPLPAPIALPAPAPPVPVTLMANVQFGFDRHEARDIVPATRRTLDELIAQLRGMEVTAIRLIGHADRLTNPAAAGYNLRLSQRRAQTVEKLLVAGGVDPAKISVVARGDTEQVQPCAERFKQPAQLRDCLQANRRVEVQVEGVRRR